MRYKRGLGCHGGGGGGRRKGGEIIFLLLLWRVGMKARRKKERMRCTHFFFRRKLQNSYHKIQIESSERDNSNPQADSNFM